MKNESMKPDSLNYIERPLFRKGSTEVVICHTKLPSHQGRFAEELMRHLAIVAAVPDGEDSLGRQKFRLMTEEEAVTRATKMAELAWAEFEKRNWILEVPLPKVGNTEG